MRIPAVTEPATNGALISIVTFPYLTSWKYSRQLYMKPIVRTGSTHNIVKVELIVAPCPTTLFVCPSFVTGPAGFLRYMSSPVPGVPYDPGAPIETKGAFERRSVRLFPLTSEGGNVDVNGWQLSFARLCHSPSEDRGI